MTDPAAAPQKERLQKILARAGFGSRRACEELIVAGRVAVNGQTVSILGAQADPGADRITVDGERVRLERASYWLLHKPAGVAFTDETMAQVVADYVPGESARLFTVGRLDRASGGLMLLTNDGRVANLLTHPRYKVPRVYQLEVSGHVEQSSIAMIERALYYAMNGGKFERIAVVKSGGRRSTLKLTCYEGLPESLRDIFLKFNHPVQSVLRVSIGPLETADLEPGRARKLKHHELEALNAYAVRAEKHELEYGGVLVSSEHFGRFARAPEFHRKHKGHRGPSTGGQKRALARTRRPREGEAMRGGDERPRFNRDRKPSGAGERPRFDRERKPSFGSDKPRFNRDRKPSFGGERPPFNRDRKPSFGGERPPFNRDRKPSFSGDRPRFDRDRKPSESGDRPRFNRDRKPSFSGDRPRFNRDRKPSFGGDRPRFNRDRKPSFSGDRPRFDRDRKPSFSGDRPRFDRDRKPSFGGDRPRFNRDNKTGYGGPRRRPDGPARARRPRPGDE